MMRRFNTHLNKLVLIAVCVGSIALLARCDKEPDIPESYIARVNDDFLTKRELSEIVEKEKLSNVQVDEFIRNWIRGKVLYNSAVAQKLDSDKEFVGLRNSAYQQILIDLFIKRNLLAIEDIDSTKLLEFYNANNDRFRFDSDMYVLNAIEFKRENDAQKFLKCEGLTFEAKVKSLFNKVDDYKVFTRRKYFEYNIPSTEFFNAVKYLVKNEYSRVIKTEQNKFIVVQLVNKIDKGSTGDIETAGAFVREAFIAEKRQVYLDKIVDRLYDDFEIEIKKDLIDYEN